MTDDTMPFLDALLNSTFRIFGCGSGADPEDVLGCDARKGVVEGEDAHRLARIADARGQKPSETLAELLREADRPAA